MNNHTDSRGGQPANTAERFQPEPAPRLLERGLGGIALAVAISYPIVMFFAKIHEYIGTATKMPAMAGHRYDYTFALYCVPFLVIGIARPARAGHWWLIVVAATANLGASILVRWGATLFLFQHFSGMQMGPFSGMLLTVAAYAAGILTFFVIHLLAGNYSPWRGGDTHRGGDSHP